MAPPDGFTTARKSVYKPVVPQFSSAFNGDRASDRKSSGSSSSKDNCGSVLSKLSIVEEALADKPKERKVLHALVPSKPDTRTFTPRTPSTFLPALHGSLISSQPKIDAPILKLRPPPKPPIMPSYHTPITTSALLKPAVPPPPLLGNKHLSKELKSLQPPVIPLPSDPVIDGKSLRTISNTRVALATDLSTDSGVAELASIFLHDQHPDITLPNSHPDDHDRRGLGLSPEKKSKGKFFKHVRYVLISSPTASERIYAIHTSFFRGGLAARASAFFEQSQTSLVLWQKETERRVNTLSSSDLRVNIIKVLQKPLPSGSKLISPGIALCRIRHQTSNANSGDKLYNIDDLYRIAFSFPSCLTKSIFNDPLQFSEGRTVRICCPWQEISCFKEESSLPASLPLPSSEPTSTPDAAVNVTTLLCSRFFIL